MSKIFRLYKEGTSTYEDWNNSPVFPYNSASRDTIEDPDGASARHEITSIPSPFARIDLIKTAFKEVCKPNKHTGKVELDGKTIFHKMVSDTLMSRRYSSTLTNIPERLRLSNGILL